MSIVGDTVTCNLYDNQFGTHTHTLVYCTLRYLTLSHDEDCLVESGKGKRLSVSKRDSVVPFSIPPHQLDDDANLSGICGFETR